MQNDEDNGQSQYGFNPFTVSAVYCDGSGKLISSAAVSESFSKRPAGLSSAPRPLIRP